MKNLTKFLVSTILAVILVPFAGNAALAAIPEQPIDVSGIGADGMIKAGFNYAASGSLPTSVTIEAVLAADDSSATISSCVATWPSTRCTIAALANGTAYYLRASASNADGQSAKAYSAWTTTPTSSPVIFGAEFDCSPVAFRVQPCQIGSGTTNATVYGQGLEACTQIDAVGGGLPGGNPITVVPSGDGTSAVLQITNGAYGWANFNCGVGTIPAFLGYSLSYLGETNTYNTWSLNTGPAGTVVEVISNVRVFVGITQLKLQGIDASYAVVSPSRIFITIPAGLMPGQVDLVITNARQSGFESNVWTVTSSGPSLSFSQPAIAPCGSADLYLNEIPSSAPPATFYDGVWVPAAGVFGSDPSINLSWEWLVAMSGNSTGYLEEDVVFTIRYISDTWNGMAPATFADSYLASASITLQAGYACGTEPDLGFGSISPSTGSIAGGTQVTITGTAFDDSTAVSIGGEVCQIISRTATQIVCLTPAGSAGSADIVIMSEGADTVNVSGAFTYVAPQTVFAPQRPTASQATVVVGPGSLKVTITYDGEAAYKPSGYSVYVKPSGNSCVINSGATSCEIIGLTSGVEYEVVITAVNQAGISPSLILPNKYLIGEKSKLKLFKKLTIRPFAGDSAKLTSKFKSQLRKFISANPKLSAFTCTGYTAGTPVRSSDKALAKSRAKAICGYIQKLNPDATTTVIGLTPGLSWSANNRKVIVNGYGLAG